VGEIISDAQALGARLRVDSSLLFFTFQIARAQRLYVYVNVRLKAWKHSDRKYEVAAARQRALVRGWGHPRTSMPLSLY
jgi:hypothetical protein